MIFFSPTVVFGAILCMINSLTGRLTHPAYIIHCFSDLSLDDFLGWIPRCTGHYSVYKMMEVKDVWLLFDL